MELDAAGAYQRKPRGEHPSQNPGSGTSRKAFPLAAHGAMQTELLLAPELSKGSHFAK